MSEPQKQAPGERFDLVCGECQSPMNLRPSKYGWFYGCSRFPECSGTHGAHKDGAPLGVPADKVTKQRRIEAHARFDRLWRDGRMTRHLAYQVMGYIMELGPDACHIGKMTRAQCELLIDRLEGLGENVYELAEALGTPKGLARREGTSLGQPSA